MSSGERTKPPAAPQAGREERNPFDITQRSERDVAAEIATRLASWKQARGRSYSTAPQASPPVRGVDGGSRPSPSLPAPVQPARMPKSAEPPAPPPTAEAALPVEPAPMSAGTREAPFAPFALSRAMPPAPSPRRPEARAGSRSAVEEPRPVPERAEDPTPPAEAQEAVAAEPPAGASAEPPQPKQKTSEVRVPPIDLPGGDLRVEPRLGTPRVEALRTERPRPGPKGGGARLKTATPDMPAGETADRGERREPFLGKPAAAGAGPTKAAASSHDAPRIAVPKRDHHGLPWMVTRLGPAERRSRAAAAPARPVRPARAKGRGGWAIGLGAVLLIAGVTFPAAIWQHFRGTAPERLDQALLDTAPAPAATADSRNGAGTESPATPAVPTAPVMQAQNPPPPVLPKPQQPQSQSPSDPAVAAQRPQTKAPADSAPAQQAAATPAPPTNPPATALGEVQDGGELAEAPIVAAPAPTGGNTDATTTASVANQPRPLQPQFARQFPTAPRPFEPDHNAPKPFQPSIASAAPLEGASVQVPPLTGEAAPVDGASAQVSLKPSLVPVLKPDPEASQTAVVVPEATSTAPQPGTRSRQPINWTTNPPQSPDQLFNLLIETLASGRPAAPVRGPGEPSNRR